MTRARTDRERAAQAARSLTPLARSPLNLHAACILPKLPTPLSCCIPDSPPLPPSPFRDGFVRCAATAPPPPLNHQPSRRPAPFPRLCRCPAVRRLLAPAAHLSPSTLVKNHSQRQPPACWIEAGGRGEGGAARGVRRRRKVPRAGEAALPAERCAAPGALPGCSGDRPRARLALHAIQDATSLDAFKVGLFTRAPADRAVTLIGFVVGTASQHAYPQR